MWQSAAFGGALSFGGSVPEEFGTRWACPGCGMDDAAATAATPWMNVRRAIMASSRTRRLARRWRHYSRTLYRVPALRPRRPTEPAAQAGPPADTPLAHVLDRHQRGWRHQERQHGRKAETEDDRGGEIDPPLRRRSADRDLARHEFDVHPESNRK